MVASCSALAVLRIAVLAGALLGPACAAVADATNLWSFDVVPYLWLASVELRTSLPDVPPSTPPDVDRFDTRISAGAMLAAQARYRSVGVFVDFAWLRLDTEALDPGPSFSDIQLKSDFIHTTAAMTYTLPLKGQVHADVLAGARLWHVSEDLEFKTGLLPGFNTSADKTWVDPVIGADLRYDLSRHWFVGAKGNVGGFDVSAQIAWEVFAGCGYRFTDWCSASIGYRYLHEDYDRDRFTFNLDAHGVLVRVGFHF